MPLSFINSNRTDSHSRSIMAAASAKQTLANLETLNTMRDNTTWISFIDNYTNMLGFEGTSFDSLRLREKLQAKQAADTAAKRASQGALFGALSLLLGALAAFFAGRASAVTPTVSARADV